MLSSIRPSWFLGASFVLVLIAVGFQPFGLPFQPGAVFSDAVISHWGAAHTLRDSITAGEYPFWQETILGGGPFAANPLNKTAYPLQWLVILLPPLTHLNTLIISHMLIGWLGMWRWARALSLSPWAAATATIAFGLSPRLWAHLGAGHLDIFYAMAWLPWLLYLLYIGPQTENSLRHVLMLSLVGALTVLADVRVAFFAAMLSAAYSLYCIVSTSRYRHLMSVSGALLFALPLLTALLVPLIEWQPFLSRGELTSADASIFSIEPLGLVGLILPAHVGGVETLVYLGIPVFVLALVGLWTRPIGERLYWIGVVLFFGLWSAGINAPLWRALSGLGFVQMFRVPGRAWLMLVPVIAMLAGYGMDAMRHAADAWREGEPPRSVFWLRLAAAGTTGIFAVCGVSLLVIQLGEFPPSAAVMLLVNSLGLGVVLMSVLLRRGRSAWVTAALLLLISADLVVTAAYRVEWRGTESWIAPHMPLAESLQAQQPARIYSPNYALPQQIAYLADFELFYGVDPFQLTGIVRAIEEGSGVSINAYSVILPPVMLDEDAEDLSDANRDATPNLDVLAWWNVSHIVSTYPYQQAGLQLVDQIGERYIYYNQRHGDPTILQASPPDYISLLPSAEQIATLHRHTIISIWVSAVSFVLVGAGITWLSIREGLRHA